MRGFPRPRPGCEKRKLTSSPINMLWPKPRVGLQATTCRYLPMFRLASGYNTRFDTVYRSVAPPARAVLLDRSLPLRHRSIEMRAAAATAASHAAEGDFDAYAEGRADVTIALESIDELARQQRAFIEAVRDYNRDIAEYALSIAPPGLANEKLVGMLIAPSGSEPGRGSNEPTMAEQPEGVRRAGFDQPIPASHPLFRARRAAPGGIQGGPARTRTARFARTARTDGPAAHDEPQRANDRPAGGRDRRPGVGTDAGGRARRAQYADRREWRTCEGHQSLRKASRTPSRTGPDESIFHAQAAAGLAANGGR